MMNGWGFTGRSGIPHKFEEQYHCYSVAYADKAHLEDGDKILLPPSAFDTLARLNVDYPMLFQLQSPDKGTMTHSGVLEFTAEEGSCYVPFWMMQNLLIEEGALLTVTNISLPKATFVKLQPQHVDFLDIHNPRAVLEHTLRKFSCVTKGDVICVPYNDKNYHFMLKEVQPQDAACIIETDCNVDFDAPVGYKEPGKAAAAASSAEGGAGGAAVPAADNPFANMPKQSARGGRASSCPSPTPSSTSGASGSAALGGGGGGSASGSQKGGIRIENGVVIRPSDGVGADDDASSSHQSAAAVDVDSALLASRTGTTGVQRNAAIPVPAPRVDYWAVNAGDGARLDGKAAGPLKDREGNVVDVRKARAEAAARRAAALAGSANSAFDSASSSSSAGKSSSSPDASTAKSQRKSRVGSKYSKLRSSGGFAFEGSAKKM